MLIHVTNTTKQKKHLNAIVQMLFLFGKYPFFTNRSKHYSPLLLHLEHHHHFRGLR